jgi:hypothetical protein
MPKAAKFLIGLAAALLAAWIGHGPLGQGEAFVDGLDARAKAEIHKVEMDQVHVRFERDPLRREAILSGPADRFQREGLGQFPGLNGRVEAVPGVSGVCWEGD